MITSGISVFFYVMAIIAAFLTKNRIVPTVLIAIGGGLALSVGHISLVSLPFLLIIFLVIYGYYHSKNIGLKWLFGLGIILMGFLTLLYKIPGINNWHVIQSHKFSVDAAPFDLFLGFDAPLIGFAFIIFGIPSALAWPKVKLIARKLVILIPLMMVTIIALAMSMNYVKWDPKMNSLFFIWSVSNLFFTCVIEEVIFRRFFQDTFRDLLVQFRYGDYLSILIAAILFGIAHIAGGVNYVILSAVSGLFYGSAYYITGRLEASILSHYILNATHFLFFTYPFLL